jgi:hypothetical protein
MESVVLGISLRRGLNTLLILRVFVLVKVDVSDVVESTVKLVKLGVRSDMTEPIGRHRRLSMLYEGTHAL